MPQIAAYGLNAPSIDDAYAAVARVCGSSAAALWAVIVDRATQMSGNPPTLVGYIDALTHDGHPVIRLCGQSLHIRQQSYAHLANVQDYVKR
jgi:hypothetical protein